MLQRYFMDEAGRPRVDAVISTLSFAASVLSSPSVPGDAWPEAATEAGGTAGAWPEAATEAGGAAGAWLARLGVPVLQAVVCSESRAAWEARATGLGPLDVAMQVALPEFDGRIITVPICFKELVPEAGADDVLVPQYVPDAERCRALARQAAAWARLRRTPPAAKRVAIVLGNYPSRNGRIGNAVGLDTPASLLRLLEALRAAGYRLGELPADGDALIHRLIDAGTYDPEFGAHLNGVDDRDQGRTEHRDVRSGGRGGADEGRWTKDEGALGERTSVIGLSSFVGRTPPGLRFGNVFVGLQPPRGWGDDPDAVYHDPALPPPAPYAAFYRWLRTPAPEGFGAHAVVHLGKHGTLEWLPGKAVGLSAACAPDALLGELPLVYPFAVDDPGEGTQAKRRAHAVLVGHLVPPLAPAGTYGEQAALERLIEEERAARVLDPSRLPLLRRRIWEAIRAAALHEDLGLPAELPPDLEPVLGQVERYLEELRQATIRDGLHVLGQAPAGGQRAALLDAMLRLTGSQANQGGGAGPRGAEPPKGAGLGALAPPEQSAALRARLDALLDATTGEMAAVLAALDGRFVPAGPSGAPTRGMWNVLPTGRNFYSVDPQAIPSPAAWEAGQRLAQALLARYLEETGRYPRTVGLVVWGTAVMRTHGDDVAQALALLGVRPVWQRESGRVTGLEPVPPAELGRPRVDVTLHISGFFRDAFPHLVALLDHAVQLVAGLDEPAAGNYVAAHVRHEAAALASAGVDAAAAHRRASYRLFGSKPGCYGAGLLPLIDQRNWRTTDDLARAYETWSAYAYGADTPGAGARDAFRARFAAIEVAAKNQDNRAHDLFDSDDYFQYHGGMVAAVRALRGAAPRAYFGDSSDPARPVVRDLAEEARRVFRSRVANPRWLAAMRRHGYKGAFEMAATVDYLFGYDATTGVAADWMYERVAAAYVFDPEQQAFWRRSSPWALRDVAARLLEAAARGLWAQPAPETLDRLRRAYLEAEGDLEARQEQRECAR